MDAAVTFLCHPMPRDCGDYRHRILWPAEALGERAPTVVIQMGHPRFLDVALHTELLVLNLLAEPLHGEIIRYRREAGKPTVFEINDDFESFAPNTQMAGFFADPVNQMRIKSFATQCDGVQFSSPFLAEKFGHLNTRHTVFMNQAWQVPTGTMARQHGGPPVLGWAASGGHLEDAKELAALLKAVFAKQPKLRQPIHLMMADDLAACFRAEGIEVVHRQPGPFADYLDFISGIDVGLAHLLDEDFANGRSDGKYLEYGSQGVVAICKEGGTFRHTIRHGDNGFLYTGVDDLAAILQRIHEEPSLVEDVRARALADLRDTRNHRVAAQARLDWYRGFVPGLGAEAQGFVHAEDPVEALFFNLLTAHSQGPVKHAQELSKGYLKIAKAHPDFHRPWNLLGDLMGRLGGEEKRAKLQGHAASLMQKSFGRPWGAVSIAEALGR